MEPIGEALQLLKRQAEIQHALRRDSTTRVIEERELYLIRQRLTRYPRHCKRSPSPPQNSTDPWSTLSIRDVEKRC